MTNIAVPVAAAIPGATEIASREPQENTTSDTTHQAFADVLSSKQAEIENHVPDKTSPSTDQAADSATPDTLATATSRSVVQTVTRASTSPAIASAIQPKSVANPKKAGENAASENHAAPTDGLALTALGVRTSQPRSLTLTRGASGMVKSKVAAKSPSAMPVPVNPASAPAPSIATVPASANAPSVPNPAVADAVAAIILPGPSAPGQSAMLPKAPGKSTSGSVAAGSMSSAQSSASVTPSVALTALATAQNVLVTASQTQAVQSSAPRSIPAATASGNNRGAASAAMAPAVLPAGNLSNVPASAAQASTASFPGSNPVLGSPASLPPPMTNPSLSQVTTAVSSAVPQVESTPPASTSSPASTLQLPIQQAISSGVANPVVAQAAGFLESKTPRASAKNAASFQAAGGRVTSALGTRPAMPVETASTEALAPIGTAIAMHSHAMANKAQTQDPAPMFKSANPEQHPAQAIAQASSRETAPSRTQPDAQPSSAAPASAATFSIATTSTSSPGSTIAAAPSATTPAAAQSMATTALSHVIESADKMRTIGQNTVEMQVKLDDGQQLTVRLQMSQGAVHTVFKTDSLELRQAIEQNWGGFRTGASERGLQISNPVFEAPSSQSGFNASANRDQSRQQGGEAPDTEASTTFLQGNSPPNPKPPISLPVAAALVGSGVQLYA